MTAGVYIREGQLCGGCAAPLLPNRRAATAGYRVHRGRGLCEPCYCKMRRPQPRGHRQALIGYSDLSVDEIVVERLIDGRFTGTPTVGEIREAVRILTRRGWSSLRIALQLDCTTRTVQRHRAAVRGDMDREAS